MYTKFKITFGDGFQILLIVTSDVGVNFYRFELELLTVCGLVLNLTFFSIHIHKTPNVNDVTLSDNGRFNAAALALSAQDEIC